MRRIEYRATYKQANGDPSKDVFAVFALNINSGFVKATRLALKGLPKGWELLVVEFWQVTS